MKLMKSTLQVFKSIFLRQPRLIQGKKFLHKSPQIQLELSVKFLYKSYQFDQHS